MVESIRYLPRESSPLGSVVRGDCSASRPKQNPPCRGAVDGRAEGDSEKKVVDEPVASVGNGVEKCGDNCR